MKSTGAYCYILQRGAQLMFYGMTNVFSFLNVNTNKEKSINTLESFVVLFPEDSSRCFLSESAAEYARYCSPRVIWKRLRQFKAIVMFFFFEEQQISVFHLIPKKFS